MLHADRFSSGSCREPVFGDTERRDEVTAFLTADDGGANDLLACTMAILWDPAARDCAAGGLDQLAQHCRTRLEARTDRPPRADDDWSVYLPSGCDCNLCQALCEFLADRTRQIFEWPIAQARRQHVHRRIDDAELPVRHQTRRRGSPYTLVLTKTDELFTREQDARAKTRSTWPGCPAQACSPDCEFANSGPNEGRDHGSG
jgi:hypothetical protein